MKRITIGMLLLAITISFSGCASIGDGIISCEMSIRNHILAQKAWGHWSWCYDKLDYPAHFAKGFKDGYRNVLDGGNGCQPTLPPQCYWKPQFQTSEGRCKINTWFDGFSHGALAAEQDGYGALGEIPISPTARTNIETARRQPATNMYNNIHTEDGLGGVEGGLILNPPITPRPAGDDLQPIENGISEPVPVRPYE